ncbi:hypothetical protein [Microbacterium elymi]|uniref:Uncharacterized protein n=1 Tax=Microbacterium elymi TaxID=2909587 RepID=A0ABY5NJS2_9MICO|nr:hypothetical protein [Microbacterium elymi]UUT35371.1 hypothetical protein L2X98_18285 [Microbacterium elymi]
MAFTRRELWHGAWVAWLAFVTLMLFAVAMATIVGDLIAGPRPGWGTFGQTSLLVIALPVAAAIGGVVAGLAALLLLPVVAVLARRLESIADLRIHAAIYATFGAAIGLAACAVFVVASGASFIDLLGAWWFVGVTMAICAASVVFGWWRAVRRARR